MKGQKPRISRSVKVCEALGKPIIIKGMKKVMPEIDSVLLSELEHVQLCKVLFVYFRIRPNTKLTDLALTGALLSKWYEVLTAARKGRERAGVTLKLDFSDVDKVAGELGWSDSWLAVKKQKGNGKGKSSSGRVAPAAASDVEDILELLDGRTSDRGSSDEAKKTSTKGKARDSSEKKAKKSKKAKDIDSSDEAKAKTGKKAKDRDSSDEDNAKKGKTAKDRDTSDEDTAKKTKKVKDRDRSADNAKKSNGKD